MSWIRKPIVLAIGAALVTLALLWLLGALTGGKRAKLEAELGRNQVEAATQSGADAVDTIGAQHVGEAVVDDLTRSNADDIRSAEGADALVAAGADAAGRRSLCKRAAYRGRPECLQLAAPR
jgi:hypothetical protein